MSRFTIGIGTAANISGEIDTDASVRASDLLRGIIANPNGITVITERNEPLHIRNSAIILVREDSR